ncbi:MAG: DDE-type integrase/transposase/recombinase [Synechococcus sp.]
MSDIALCVIDREKQEVQPALYSRIPNGVPPPSRSFLNTPLRSAPSLSVHRYVRIRGRWCYLYRESDSDGNLVDSRQSQKRDMTAAKAVFRQALEVAEQPTRTGGY